MGSEYFVNSLDAENVTNLVREIGHTFGLDGSHDWTPTGVGEFIMRAGRSPHITEVDAWMFRDFWRNVKHRYGRWRPRPTLAAPGRPTVGGATGQGPGPSEPSPVGPLVSVAGPPASRG